MPREVLDLYGDLELKLPNGQQITARASGARAIIDRPDPTRPSHAPDWSVVVWNGTRYNLTPKQRDVIAVLWAAWEDGTRFVGGAYLLERADSDQGRLSALFRDSPAWKRLIVPGEQHGGPVDTYCLAPPTAA